MAALFRNRGIYRRFTNGQSGHRRRKKKIAVRSRQSGSDRTDVFPKVAAAQSHQNSGAVFNRAKSDQEAKTSTRSSLPENQTASFAAFTGRARTILRAGLALNIIGSPVKGFVPLRAFVAGFLMTTNLANPGRRNTPFFFSSL